MKNIMSGNFLFKKTEIEGVVIVEMKSHRDSRGYFMETYKKADFVAGGINVNFVQDNQSMSFQSGSLIFGSKERIAPFSFATLIACLVALLTGSLVMDSVPK